MPGLQTRSLRQAVALQRASLHEETQPCSPASSSPPACLQRKLTCLGPGLGRGHTSLTLGSPGWDSHTLGATGLQPSQAPWDTRGCSLDAGAMCWNRTRQGRSPRWVYRVGPEPRVRRAQDNEPTRQPLGQDQHTAEHAQGTRPPLSTGGSRTPSKVCPVYALAPQGLGQARLSIRGSSLRQNVPDCHPEPGVGRSLRGPACIS